MKHTDPNSLVTLYQTESAPLDAWKLVSDQVMGGLSNGKLVREEKYGCLCDCMTGAVSLANNGGFLQMKLPVAGSEIPGTVKGLFLELAGSPDTYNVHIKTHDLMRPWQSYRLQVNLTEEWQRFVAPWAQFKAHRTDTPLQQAHITSVAIVAIGKAFVADVAVRKLGYWI